MPLELIGPAKSPSAPILGTGEGFVAGIFEKEIQCGLAGITYGSSSISLRVLICLVRLIAQRQTSKSVCDTELTCFEKGLTDFDSSMKPLWDEEDYLKLYPG
jgi:hypothetical protein